MKTKAFAIALALAGVATLFQNCDRPRRNVKATKIELPTSRKSYAGMVRSYETDEIELESGVRFRVTERTAIVYRDGSIGTADSIQPGSTVHLTILCNQNCREILTLTILQ